MSFNNLLQQYALATDTKFKQRVLEAWFVEAQAVASEVANDVQTLTDTGATAGTFTLSFGGQTTAAINWNASAGDVQVALQALSSIGSGNVVCSGGPLPGTAVTITFTGTRAAAPQSLITHTDTLTGGSASLAHTTPGVSYPNHANRAQLIKVFIANLEQYNQLFAHAVAGNATVQGDFSVDAQGNVTATGTEAQILSDIEFTVSSVWNTFV